MDNFKDGLILYHGSYCEVKIPDLKCSNSKDFGQGLYLTVSKLQAKDLIKESIVKSTITGEISEIKIMDSFLSLNCISQRN